MRRLVSPLDGIRSPFGPQFGFNPLKLFAAGEQGVWYDPSDLTTLFQDSAGTTPVTGLEQPVGLLQDKSGRGNHASQATSASRPVLSARYNLLTYTEQFDNAAWTKTNVTIGADTTDTTDPLGGNTADKVTPTITNGAHTCIAAGVVIVGAATHSVYVKANGYNKIAFRESSSTGAYAAFDLATASVIETGNAGAITVSSATITAVGSGWYRLSCVMTATTATQGLGLWLLSPSYTTGQPSGQNWTGNTTSGMYIWGADLRVTNDGVGLPAYQRVGAATAGSSTAAGTADYDDGPQWPRFLRFDGTDDTLVGPAISNVISASAYEACVGARFNTVTTNNAASWLNQSLVTDSAGYVGIGMAKSTGVVGAFNFDVTQDEITVAMAPPATIVLQQRHSGGDLTVSTNGGAEVSTASGNTAALTGVLQLLKAFGAVYTNGRLYSAVIRNSAFTSAERASLLAWVNGKTKAY
jgi:hypothetical protein